MAESSFGNRPKRQKRRHNRALGKALIKAVSVDPNKKPSLREPPPARTYGWPDEGRFGALSDFWPRK